MVNASPTAVNADPWVDDVKVHTGIGDDRAAESVLLAVLESLGDVLSSDEARMMEELLPARLAQAVQRGAEHGFAPGDFDDLIDGVEWREKTSSSTAFEHATAVLEVLARHLAPEAREALVARLPSSIARRLDPRSTGGTSAGRAPAHDPRAPTHTLATGRPGSLHPISDARPDLAHSQSVARAANPHGETKLSSTRGLTQERLHETLAEGHPGPSRPVSGG